MLESKYNIEKTINYGKLRGWSESQILADVRLRLSKGEDINQQVDGGSTPLMSAAAAGYSTIVRALLEAGADPALKNRWKEDAVICAKLSEKKEIIDLINNALKENNGASAVARMLPLYFRPKAKTEAEYTFFPSKQFKVENNSKENDVGFFLNNKEVLKLEPIKGASKKGGVLTIYVNEGRVTLNIDDWDEVTEDKVVALVRRSTVNVHDISNIVREYLSD